MLFATIPGHHPDAAIRHARSAGSDHILRVDTDADGVTTVTATSRAELDALARTVSDHPDWPAWIAAHAAPGARPPRLAEAQIGRRAALCLALSYDGAMIAACDPRRADLTLDERCDP